MTGRHHHPHHPRNPRSLEAPNLAEGQAEQLAGHQPAQARFRAASLALGATIGLTASKLAVSVATGSVGILSEAIHSGLDLLSSLVTFFVVSASAQPADEEHPFGHGKIESLSALLEAFLLLVAAGYIVYEGISRFLGAERHELRHLDWGLVVTGASVLVNLFVYFQNRTVAKSEESIAIETNAFHFLTDVFSSLAVFVSLGLVHYTSWPLFDPIVALLIAVYIFTIGVAQMRKCLAELSDSGLPADEIRAVQAVLVQHRDQYLNYHDLRTRKSGATRHVDLHLTVCSEQKVHEAHAVCDAIEADIGKNFKEAHTSIHIEPCGTHGPACAEECLFYHRSREVAGKRKKT